MRRFPPPPVFGAMERVYARTRVPSLRLCFVVSVGRVARHREPASLQGTKGVNDVGIPVPHRAVRLLWGYGCLLRCPPLLSLPGRTPVGRLWRELQRFELVHVRAVYGGLVGAGVCGSRDWSDVLPAVAGSVAVQHRRVVSDGLRHGPLLLPLRDVPAQQGAGHARRSARLLLLPAEHRPGAGRRATGTGGAGEDGQPVKENTHDDGNDTSPFAAAPPPPPPPPPAAGGRESLLQAASPFVRVTLNASHRFTFTQHPLPHLPPPPSENTHVPSPDEGLLQPSPPRHRVCLLEDKKTKEVWGARAAGRGRHTSAGGPSVCDVTYDEVQRQRSGRRGRPEA